MENMAKKIMITALGVCCWSLWFVFLFSVTKPYTEKVAIWLPDNYELENDVKNEVVSIMPKPIDNSYQFNKATKIFSQTDMDSFKRLFGKSKLVEIRIEDATIRSNREQYTVIYQARLNYGDDLIIVAQEYYRYNKKTLLGVRLVDRVLLLENKRDATMMYFLSIVGFIVIFFACFVFYIIKGKVT